MRKIYIKADNFRDHAIGIADMGDYDLICEMTYGYSDLYIRDKEGNEVDCLAFEEPTHDRINEIAREFGVQFV